ncbi:hypothetical protein QTI33_20715 [Variovorax sp. J22P271]|uniref:hypothetical protein n=1 Tax=Variovorax davisae TaxID=3053515 RepID=UPI002574B83B|nr:hypothetical protein [Variovorax sp. J22P271]MDM0034572.1 hypothetical protein [Variovorax sp. J22P271]
MLVTLFIVVLCALAIVVWIGALLSPLGLLSGVWAHQSAKAHRARVDEIDGLLVED